ncbi:hypothetical protein BH09MYX1_BH09MYX1_30370 [soil metagenome]
MRQRLLTMRILWMSLIVSVLAFAAVVFYVEVPQVTPQAFMLPAFGVVAIANAVISVVFPAHQRKKMMVAQLSRLVVERANPAAEVTFREAAPPIKVFDDPRAVWAKAFALYQTPFILALAISESVGLFGVVLVFQGFPRVTALPFLALSLMLQIARFPTAEKIAASVKSATGVDLPIVD